MNTPAQAKTQAPKTSKGRGKPAKPVGPSALTGTPDARRHAALILEVLCGVRSPTEAAKAMQVALPRYYLLETRALQGLIQALEPRARGPGRDPEAEIVALQRQIHRQKQELTRGQSLMRASQRALGLPPPASRDQKQPADGKIRKPRRPSVRALKAAAFLRAEPKPNAAEKPHDRKPTAAPTPEMPS